MTKNLQTFQKRNINPFQIAFYVRERDFQFS